MRHLALCWFNALEYEVAKLLSKTHSLVFVLLYLKQIFNEK